MTHHSETVDGDDIGWTRVRTEDWGGGPEHTYRALNVEHAGCGGDVLCIELRDVQGELLDVYHCCAGCDEDLTA